MPVKETRMWRCPGCSRTISIAADQEDPQLCEACACDDFDKRLSPERPASKPLTRDVPPWAWGVIGGFVLLVIVGTFVGYREPEQKPDEESHRPKAERESAKIQKSKSDPATSNKIGAYVAAKQFVEKRLVAPRSAKHPWQSYRGVTTALGNYRYRVESYVDAQNGFGAMLRKKYKCVVLDQGDNNFRLESLEFY